MFIFSARRRRTRRVAVALCLGLAASIVALPVATAEGRSSVLVPAAVSPLPPATAGTLDLDAHPVLNWSVPDRYAGSWAAYNQITGYNEDYVNPKPGSWSLNLDGCASTSKYAITRYTFTVAQGTTWTRTFESTSCRLAINRALPSQGYYTATLVLHTTLAFNTGVSAPLTKNVLVQDILIVAMGDSLASGEGNPDTPGVYSYGINSHLTPTVHVTHPVGWKDARCHRSARSGPALAAQALEAASPYTSVTFISLACSGAEVRHLITDSYGGIAPDGVVLPPQVDSVSALVGATAPNGARTIDALVVSAGINDLDFSGIITACALNNNLQVGHSSCVRDGGIETAITELKRQYAYLALTLQVKLPNSREVYLNDYPAGVFTGGACGLLGAGVLGAVLGIDGAEGTEMQTQGIALDWQIIRAADQYRTQTYRWNLLGSLSTAFDGHQYCSSSSWFNTLEHSLATQGDVEGTAHPNAAGHLAYAQLLQRAIVPNQVSTAYRHLTITITQIKAQSSALPPIAVDPVLFRYQNDYFGETHSLQVPRNGQWTTIPAAAGAFHLDVFPTPSSPRHAVEVYMSLGHIFPIHHTLLSDGYGIGTHEVTYINNPLTVRYTITATS